MSIHKTLEKVRKPRVHIKYEVETEGGSVAKELPFVIGVLGDFSGTHPVEPLAPLKERQFMPIDRDNFNQVMQIIHPGLQCRIPNVLTDDDTEIPVSLQFQSLEDFEPEQLVKQIEPLNQLLDARNKLQTLLNKVDCSSELESLVENILTDQNNIKTLYKQLTHETASNGSVKNS